jgi:hypothetical protein
MLYDIKSVEITIEKNYQVEWLSTFRENYTENILVGELLWI